jgi:hypothetical protein
VLKVPRTPCVCANGVEDSVIRVWVNVGVQVMIGGVGAGPSGEGESDRTGRGGFGEAETHVDVAPGELVWMAAS